MLCRAGAILVMSVICTRSVSSAAAGLDRVGLQLQKSMAANTLRTSIRHVHCRCFFSCGGPGQVQHGAGLLLLHNGEHESVFRAHLQSIANLQL